MKIQASIAGFAGQPKTIVALLDQNSGIVTIGKGLATFRKERIGPEFSFISNYAADSDLRFSDQELSESVSAYFEYQHSGLIQFAEPAIQYQPDNYIELEGVSESGRKYRISPDMTGGQVGVLAVALFCQKQFAIASCLRMFDQINDSQSTDTDGVFSI